ncbi:MAG: PKD domain-containing protein, partial [Flavobacteriales bacterium]|nr:PKD domain-containing protein [Flavobacteriales bacterium]
MFRFILILSLLFTFIESYSQSSCNNSAPFCTSTGVTFPASTNTTAPVGPDYGCLGSQPNPAWYYLNISTGGNIDITLSNSANVDIDFAAWGPFASQAAMQAAVCGGTSGSPIDCSFSAAANEIVSLPNTQPGEWYMLLITNFSGQPTNITATQTGGSGATNCAILCNMTGLTAVPGACNSANNQYDVTGTINVTNPPTTGTLTITNSCGGSTVINPPFATSINYTISGVTANGANCTITATFSADPTCTLTQNYTSPPACNTVSCNINNFTANIGACQPNNTYTVNGTIDFTTGITTDSLVITINDGINTYDTIIYPPYVSPMNWSISGMNSNGNNITITATFAADPSCTASLNSTAPASCGCVAQIGNFNINMTGNSTTNYVLCFGDQIDITSNIGYNPPDIANNPPGPAYNPGIGYLVYSCPPTIGVVPSNVAPNDDITNDPCFVGVAGFGSSFSSTNTLGQPPYVGTWTSNTLYYVPITFYDTISGTYSYVNTNMPCYDMGNPIAVQYLPEIVSSNPTEDCLDSSFTITITGGLPAINGSNFTASNLSPANASFVNTTTPNGGTIQINGLLNGDMYSFDVVDDNGCPITISGGPFVGLPNANAGVDDTSCVLTYALNAIPSIGTGSWSGPAGVVFNPVNSPTATVTVPSAGTYNFTWTETNTAACVTSDVVTITFSNLSESTVTTPATCSANDGTITITAIDGVSPYQYSIDGGATFQAGNTFSNLAANTYNIVVEDAVGCQVTASYTVNSIAGPTINSSNFTDPTCNGDCDGTVTVTGTSPAGGEQYSIDGINFQASGTFNNLCAGTYTVTISDANSCTDTVSLTLTDPDSVTISASDVTICTGQSATLTATAGGGSGSGYTYNWNNGASTTSTYTVSPLTTTSYPVFAIDGNGCTSPTINVTVTVNPPLSVVASPSDTSICPGESVTIYATPFFGNGGPYTYQWSNGSTDSSQVVSPATTTVYTVTLGDGCSPTTTGTVTINVMPLPQVSFTADKFEACETPVETFEFYNTTDTTGGMVGSSIWDFGDGSSSVGDTVTHAYNNAGTYDVTLTITSSVAAGGCTNSTTYPNYITIHQN